MKKSKKLWVVDLGEALTKMVVGSIDESGMVQIKDFRIEKTLEQIWSDVDANKKPKTRGFLRSLLRGHRRNDEVILLINHQEMMVETFTFPMMTIAEVEEAIFWQMQQLTSENMEYWRIDFLARERTQWLEYLGMNDKSLDVMGVAVKKTFLGYCTRIFRQNGCVLNAIIPQFCTFDTLMNQTADQQTVIIDMGKECTRFFYYQGDSLSENHRIRLEKDWDGEAYLQQIIKTTKQILLPPLGGEKVEKNGNIYLMGGESLHRGVLEYLRRWMNKEIKPAYFLLDEKEDLIFPRLISKAELCLITPCVCGLIKSAQNSGRVKSL